MLRRGFALLRNKAAYFCTLFFFFFLFACEMMRFYIVHVFSPLVLTLPPHSFALSPNCLEHLALETVVSQACRGALPLLRMYLHASRKVYRRTSSNCRSLHDLVLADKICLGSRRYIAGRGLGLRRSRYQIRPGPHPSRSAWETQIRTSRLTGPLALIFLTRFPISACTIAVTISRCL